jgi:Putative restriction endonuclease
MSTAIATEARYTPEKLDDYRTVGVPLIWVIYPELRKVKIFRLDGSAGELREDDVLSGEVVIPGFRCSLRAILPRRAPADELRTMPAGPNGAGSA